MRFSSLAIAAGLAGTAVQAADLLFVDTLLYAEYIQATSALGFSADIVSQTDFQAMTSADFAQYKAIIISDPDCGQLPSIQFLDDSKANWSPAITGNMIIIGTDPSRHFGQGGAEQLINQSIQFAAAGNGTGLYLALSCYYNDSPATTVDSLTSFGTFTIRGQLDCYNDVHIVASNSALSGLTDADLSNYNCSIHEAFVSYPTMGVNSFQALAIANNVLGTGSQQFADKSVGIPYIISRGGTPVGCGNGIFEPAFGEECDDGNTVNGDGCNASCKCESGNPLGNGQCGPPLDDTTTTTTRTSTGSTTVFITSTIAVPNPSATVINSTTYTTATTNAAVIGNPYNGYTTIYGGGPIVITGAYCGCTYTQYPYATPSVQTTSKIVGVEIICQAGSDGNPTATMQRPIYDYSTSGYPCYVCELTSEGYSYTDFFTVSTTQCNACATTALPVVYPCDTCAGTTLTTNAPYTPAATGDNAIPYTTYAPHVHSQPAGGSGEEGSTYATPAVTPAGTGYITPSTYETASAAAYTGAAPSVGVGAAFGMFGGAVLGLAALL